VSDTSKSLAAAIVAEAVENSGGNEKSSFPPMKKSVWELVLDPRTIQWLLGLGGALLVLGLVIWLATLGVFDSPAVVAVALGAANLAALGAGWAVIRCSASRRLSRSRGGGGSPWRWSWPAPMPISIPIS